MGKIMLALLLAVTVGVIGCPRKASLVRFDSEDYGDKDRKATATELERNGNTSKIKVVFQKRGGAVGDSIFIVMATYKVAEARNYKYFVNLKEWDDKDGERIYIAGFTNKKDADIKKEFGEQYTYENESGQKCTYMSVSDWKEAMDSLKMKK